MELRSGKHGLSTKRGIKTLGDLEAHVGDLLYQLAERTRYTVPVPGIGNVSRRPLHPLWRAVRTQLPTNLTESEPPVSPETIKEAERSRLQEIYRQQAIGNIAGYAGVQDMAIDEIPGKLPALVGKLIEDVMRQGDSREKALSTVKRVRARLGI